MCQDIRNLEMKLMEIKTNSRYVMLANLVEACIEPSTKTDIFYSLKTSYLQYQRLLRMALDKGLIKKEGINYVATLKGKEYVKKLNELLSLLEG